MPEPKPQHGYLVLADISGFLPFVTSTELEHAQDIMRELLELIVQRLTPTLMLAALEGDAVFAYAPHEKLKRGETLLELTEATYVTFRERQTAMQRRTTCTCQACRSINVLDLKFMAHYGEYVMQHVSEHDELLSLDVNLVRERLLKNQMSAANAWRGYVLFTEACLTQMGVRPVGMTTQTARYEHIGDVQTHTLNLQARYQAMLNARREFITAAEADHIVRCDFAAPPPVVWEWLNDPRKRTQWMQNERVWSEGARPTGRTDIGAVNHCDHNSGHAIETILDWRPFDYFTVAFHQARTPLTMFQTMQLESLPNGGTRLHGYFKIRERLPRWLVRWLWQFVILRMANIEPMWKRMTQLMNAEAGQV
jgi:hypothetical protein